MTGFDGKNPKSNVKTLRSGQPAKPAEAKAELLRLRNQITALIQKNPEKAATVLNGWLSETSQISKTTKKKAG